MKLNKLPNPVVNTTIPAMNKSSFARCGILLANPEARRARIYPITPPMNEMIVVNGMKNEIVQRKYRCKYGK
jgi:hypothetical protein